MADTDKPAASFWAISTLKQNVIANLLGRGWSALMALAFVPFYLRYIGVEGYALVGFSLTLFAIASLLDLGVGTTLNRELARRAATRTQAQDARDLVRTLEAVYWLLALVIGVTVFLAAPAIAHYWVKSPTLAPATIEQAIRLMGIALAFQWPMSLYSGGLLGLERQVKLNQIMAVMSTVRGAGAVLVLWLVAPTIEAFFVWQIVASILQTAWSAIALWRALPAAGAPVFRAGLIMEIGGFAAGVTGISVFSLILTQLDKIVLSALLPLETFGFYTLAGVVASAATIPVAPIFAAVFPRMSRLVAQRDEARLADLYHVSSQLISVAMLPFATVIMFFAPEILFAWTRNPAVAEHSALLVTLITAGAIINASLNIPYALQLAYGWVRLGFWMTLVNVVLLVPAIYYAAVHYGAAGAAAVWVGMNACNLLVGIHLLHRRLLVKEKWRWAIQDFALPLATALSIGAIARAFFPPGLGAGATVAALAGVGVLIALACAMIAPAIRGYTFNAAVRLSAVLKS